MIHQHFSGVGVNGTFLICARRCALAVVALGLALVWQHESRAACGDYVLVRNAGGRLVRASELAGGSPTDPHGPASLPFDCRGPSCSGRPLTPSAPPPSSPNIRLAPEAMPVTIAGDEHVLGLTRLHPQSDPLRPVHHPGHIFRPPK